MKTASDVIERFFEVVGLVMWGGMFLSFLYALLLAGRVILYWLGL